MKLSKLIPLILAVILAVGMLGAVPSSAAGISGAHDYGMFRSMSVKNSSSRNKSYYFRISIPKTCKLKFYADAVKVSDNAEYSFLNSKGKNMLTGKAAELIGKRVSFKKSGTYYLRLSLDGGDEIKKMFYAFIDPGAVTVSESFSVRVGGSIDTAPLVAGFAKGYKWVISDDSAATVKDGKIIALSPGRTVIEAFSPDGDWAEIDVRVKEDTTDSIELLGANMIWVGESFDYSFRYGNGKEYPTHKIVWSLSGDNGKVNKNGRLSALKSGTATLTVTDKTAELSASMTVHFISSADEVDFVPVINGIPIANKTYPLPKTYSPGADPQMLAAYNKMAADAAAEGLKFTIISSYRSYSRQIELNKYWTDLYGKTEADRCSARAGHSEHQLGLAIDVNSCYYEFANTPESKWLAKNCWKYGFILRYPTEASEKVTGYIYEPWHIRYLGKDTAKKVYQSGLTLEEYLGIDSYYRY